MKLEVYYLVRKYAKDGSELTEPTYKAGPFSTWLEADMHRASIWLDNKCFVVVRKDLNVEEM